jgi:hypothetical protein
MVPSPVPLNPEPENDDPPPPWENPFGNMGLTDRWRSSPELFVEKSTLREDMLKESPNVPLETEPA